MVMGTLIDMNDDNKVILFCLVLALAVFGLAYIEAYGADGVELFIHNLCFDMFELDRVVTSINSDVLNCQQALLLQEIRDILLDKTDDTTLKPVDNTL